MPRSRHRCELPERWWPMVEGVRFGVLGPLEVRYDGRAVPVRAGQQRVVLAVLLLRPNRTVPMSQLVDRLWGESTPADARGTVQKYVMRLRRLLAEVGWDGLRTEPDGYRIEVAAGQLDLERFETLAREAIQASEPGDAVRESAVLADALALWRGVPPLSNVASESLQRHDVPGLLERYLHVMERRVEVDLGLGRGAELIGELTRLVRDYPLRERLWGQRMRALHQAGRQGEALQAYREVTRLLADELGVDPGAELRAAHQEVLRVADPSTVSRASAPHGGNRGPRPVAVGQLPMAAGGFVGRSAELEQIVYGLAGAGAAPVVVVSGPAGVGKTTLAVQAAHRVAERFGDGQLFADLRGYAPAAPLNVEEVLGQFLRGLGMAPEAAPLSRDDQVLAYRSLLVGRRVLVVLDNVGGVEDVRALLPGAPGCAVLVTSRGELAGLAVSPGAAQVALGMLSRSEARMLLGRALGEARVAAEENAAAELVALCGGLPLALRVAVAHLLLRPQLGLGDYAGQLKAQDPVTTLRVPGDEHANLAAAFDWSYRLLLPGQQQMLRLLSLVPGPDVTTAAAAALADVAEADAAGRLEALAATSLLERGPRFRFRLHDLIRGYASHRCRIEEPEGFRDDARRRLLQHYTRVADAVLQPLITVTRLPRPAPSALPVDANTALADLDDDQAAMVAAVRGASVQGPFDAAYHLADALRGYFALRGHTVDWLTTAEAGLHAAQQAGDEEATAAMLNSRGHLRLYIGDNDRAEVDFQAALEIYERVGSPGANSARMNLGLIAHTNGDLERAIKHYEAVLTGHHPQGTTNTLYRARLNLIIALEDHGDLTQAEQECKALATETAWPGWHLVLCELGQIMQLTGDLKAAAEQLSRATAEVAAHGDRRAENASRVDLGACCLELGDDSAAYEIAEETLVWSEQHDPRIASRARLLMARASTRMGNITQAAGWYERALQGAKDIHDRRQECDALIGRAEFELALGAPGTAVSLAAEAAALARAGMLRTRLSHALVVLAGCHRGDDELDQARATAAEALSLARDCRYPLAEGMSLAELGEIHLAAGDLASAASHWRHAHTIYASIASRRAADVAQRLAAHGSVVA